MKKRLLLTLLLPLTLLSLTASADQYDRRLIHTNGYGEVKVKPDMATVHLNVTATRKQASAAKKEVDDRVNGFLAKLKKFKIADKDIVASSLRTHPRYEYNRISAKQSLTGYQATRSINITVRRLKQLTELMDVALAENIQGINNIVYDSSKADQHRNQARLNAIENSKQKAAGLAKAYGAELGAVVQITYHSTQPNFGMAAKQGQLHRAMEMSASADGLVNQGVYLPDELTFSDNIQVVFDLIINE